MDGSQVNFLQWRYRINEETTACAQRLPNTADCRSFDSRVTPIECAHSHGKTQVKWHFTKIEFEGLNRAHPEVKASSFDPRYRRPKGH